MSAKVGKGSFFGGVLGRESRRVIVGLYRNRLVDLDMVIEGEEDG